MKVPRSTYVMGAIVVGLFGLAIATSAGGKDRPHGDDTNDPESLDDDERSARETAQYEREEAMRKTAELEAERKIEKLVAAVAVAYGAEAASMGNLFAGVTLGTQRSALSQAMQDRFEAFRSTTESKLTFGERSSRAIDRIEVAPLANGDREIREPVCEKLRTLLQDTWGHGTSGSVTGPTIWLNPTTHVRSTFVDEEGSCTLTFSSYAAPDQWIARATTSIVPFAAVGQPAAKLSAAVHTEIQDETITWTGPGVGAGTQGTQLMASVIKGKVSMLTATTTAVDATRSELIAHLTRTFGKPNRALDDSGGDVLTWPSKPPIVLIVGSGDTVTLTVGKI